MAIHTLNNNFKYIIDGYSNELLEHHKYCIDNNIPILRVIRRVNTSMIVLDICTLNEDTKFNIKGRWNKDEKLIHSYLEDNKCINKGSKIYGLGRDFCYISKANIDKEEETIKYLLSLYGF